MTKYAINKLPNLLGYCVANNQAGVISAGPYATQREAEEALARRQR